VTAKAIALPGRLPRRVERGSLLVGAAVVLASLVFARMLTDPHQLRLAVVGLAILLAVAFAGSSPIRLLYALVVWLTALGFLRRTLNVISPEPHVDLLLLVGPFAIGVLFVAAAKNGAFRERSGLASAVLALNVLIFVGAFNPLQGGLATGLAGLLFVLVPTLAFWIGRGLCDDRTVATLLKLFAVLSIPAATYGLAQTFAGFPSWDSTWIAAHETDYGAITVDGAARAFASFSAASEYTYFLAIGLVIWIAFGLTPVLAPVAVGAIALLAVAIFYEGARGIVIVGFVALAMMAGVRAGVRLQWSLALGAVLVLLLPYAVAQIVRSDSGGYSTPFVARQVQGLRNPTDPKVSTLHAHIALTMQGLRSARHEPVGRGTGVVTIAGEKFGGVSSGAEADPGNAAVAWGIPGLLLYIVIAFEAIRRGYRLALLRRRYWAAPAAFAVIVLTTFQWLNGGQYAVAFLPWLLMGWIDRSLMKDPPPTREPL
jgi:hypothetical protein